MTEENDNEYARQVAQQSRERAQAEQARKGGRVVRVEKKSSVSGEKGGKVVNSTPRPSRP